MHTHKNSPSNTVAAHDTSLFQQAFQLHQQGQLEQAEALYEALLKTEPQHIDALHFSGVLANQRGQAQRAVDLISQSLAINANNAAAYSNLGLALHELKRFDEAIASYNRALAINPSHADAHFNRGHALRELKRFPEAIACYEQALAIKPNLDFILGTWLYLKMNLCAWDGFAEHLNALFQGIERGEKMVIPFSLLAMSSSLALQKRAAEIYTTAKHPSAPRLPLPAKHAHAKIKIGYFSSDFRQHPVSYLTAELFERHDRSRFEIIAFSFHAVDIKDAMRLRLEAAFDQFHDVSQQSDQQIVDLARQLEIDIAVDLNGCTDGCRTDIFAMRAAPIQVNYLGYLGTMGADYIDYVLADSTLITPEHQAGYNEKIAYLPHSFQVNDSTLAIADSVFTRTELGLPEQGFVFCCFNNHYKITPAVFDSWMRILHQVDGSVLWLLGANNDVEHNLRHAALDKGIDSNRLVFANRVPMPEYLARHRCADLFLDTQPYNAGATASAALWAGLPVLTCLGDTLSGRMGASLLQAIGLPELIARNPDEYEALAIQLAAHPEQLSAVKHKLAANRLSSPLFDTPLFTHHIEAAFQAMFARYQADLAPDHIYVEAQDTPPVDANTFAQALSLHQQGQLAAAEQLYTAILHAQPQHSDALHFFGVLKNQQRQAQRAVELITRALDFNPDNAAAHSNLGLAMHAMKRFADAIASYNRALAIKPTAEAYYNRGNSLLALDHFDAALASYDHALSIKHDYLEALSNRGIVLRSLNRFDEALSNYQLMLRIKPDSAKAEHGYGVVLQDLKRFDEAIVHYDRALALKPDLAFIRGTRLYLKRMICDWQDIDSYLAELMSSIARNEQAAIPFSVLAMTDSLAVQKKAAEIYTETQHPSASLLPPIAKYSHKKIRLGYFSADFHRHATAYLIAELFERHDRERFELIAFSFGSVNDKNEMRLRLEAGFDQFHEVSQQSDEDIARLARQLEIDIAVDLKGFTQDYRATIFALRTAPIQVSYLGYPGTMGADYIDYIIADSVLIPEAYQPYYTEKVVYLPDSYQVNDSTRVIADKQFTRAELGLPEQGFVFCCFNNNYKITPEVFASWMRIMRRIDGSVLWLLEDNNSVVRNLRREAQARGIAAERLIFAERMPLPEHLARHQLADLFLDTLPCNAHTTASDALWAGLPVLTCMGAAFAARVAASLLSAVGLPELITSTAEDYEALAIRLATYPEQLAAIKNKLADQRLSCPLFDTARFTRHIESAYQTMYDRYQADSAPDHIYVTAQSDCVTPVMHAESLQRAHALHLSALLASQRGDWQQAVELLHQSLASNPDNAAAYLDLGSAFQELHNFNQALASYDRALTLKPDYVEAFYNRGNLFLDDQQFDKAVLSYDSALRLKPNDANTLHNRGIALKNLQRYDEAVASYGQALAINPDTQFLFGDWLYLKMSVCNWDNLDQHLDELEQGIAQGKPISVPFTVLAFSNSLTLQKKVAVSYAAEKYPSAPLLPLPPKHAHKKIKIGYFSADFYHHATAYLMAELFERHDKVRFDMVAFSFSPVNHQDALRLRLENAFDRFIDVSQQSDEQVVRLARQLEIDIAVDLKGYTEHSRPNIFALRAASIQVNYLGYPSTMGADYMDYLLADTVLIPDEYQAYYSEKIAYLPHSYQVNDAKRVIANKTFTRAELGLPAHGIVFCCFNSNYKITPAVFDSWMRILHEVDGSVLWLLEDNASAVNNLRKEASACGIDPKRLCFAKRMTLAEHLARHRVADLFLDTSPCNAHTTASDALWAGLPVLTCIGDTFAGRVAASLLTAIGLPELITSNLEDYEALAIQLATHPKQLAALKQKLADNRLRYPLFDTPLFTQHIESAYQLMFDRYQADLMPEHIYVPAQAVSKQPPPEVNRATAKHPPEPAKSSGLFAKLLTGITRRKNKAADAQQPDESFTQAEANTFERAQRLHQQGQLTAAAILYEQLLKTQPHHTELLRCLAALKKLHPQPANNNTEQLLAHLNQCLEYQDANRLIDALNSYERVLAIDPHHVDALINRGNVLEDMNRLNDALASYDRAIAAQPTCARAHSNRGNVLQLLQRFDEALASYDKALAIQPDYAVAFYNRGNTLQACKRPQDAIQSYQYALAIKPDFIQAVISLGNALHDDQQFEEALASYDRALAIQPDHAEALYNRGNVLHDLNRYSDAIDSYNRALTIKPDDAGARWNSSFCYLILGDFDNGWKNYEARWQTDDFIKAARHFTAPQWSGNEALQGKTILLYGEQGLGDTLHFCRYAKQVAALGGRVILEAPKALLPLLAQLEGVEQWVAQGEPLPNFDFHSPLLSLPLAFKTRLDSIPADIPYLFSQADKVQHWQAVLGAKTLPRIGVVWSGNAAHKNNHNRSVALHELLPLLTLDCQFISLQKELRDTDKALLAQQPRLQHYGTQLHDFTDTAALIELMDVVISVDTSVAHLAAAMGKPTWILVADNQDWRWLLNRDDSPWYPSVRLFRQTQRGDWQPVIEQVQHELGGLFGQHTTTIQAAQPSAAFQQAVELHQQGQLAQAESLYQEILRTQPDNADALHLLGVIAKQKGQAQTAIDLISQSLKINPDNSAAHSNIGLAFQALNRFDEALSNYHHALKLNPDHADALFNQGITLQCLNRSEDALASYDRALSVQPDHAETLFNRGVVLQSLKRLEEALASYHRALIIKPDYAQALYGCGIVLSELKRFNEALASYDRALAIKPDYVEALSNRGGMLSNLNRFAEALDSYDNTLRVQPDYAPALYNRGNVLQDLKRYQEAIDSYQRALIIQPDYAEAHWNSGFCSLLLGDFDSGWQQHEWRWQTDNLKDYVRDFSQPLWLGEVSLQGKTILLHSEQGLGDTLQFCRYAKQVADLGGRVILDVQKPLSRLLSHLEGVEQLIIQGDALPAFDFHCPLLSLPLAFKTQLDSIPADTPYLFSEADKVTQWQALLGEKTLPRIGLVWSGSATHKNDHHRSLALAELLPLLTLDCQFISLQKELRDTDKALLAQQPRLQHYGAQLHDFTDTAALIELMDVVISVDTSVAHLAAAMGKATWILVAENQDWRWLLNRADSPWYPSVRLFKQTQRGDWQNVIQQVKHALSQLPAYPSDDLNTAQKTTPSSLDSVDVLINQGNDLEDVGRFDEALAHYDRALIINPDYARAHSNRGNALQLLQRFADALASYDKALDIRPDYAEAFFNRGNVLRALHRFDEALSSYDYALAIKPEFILAFIGRGVVLQDLNRFEDALDSYDRALVMQPDYAEAHYNRGNMLQELQRFEDALAAYDAALNINPEYVEALGNRGAVLQHLQRFTDALDSYDRALLLQPSNLDILEQRGIVLQLVNRIDDALRNYEHALALNPDREFMFGTWLSLKMKQCDWPDFAENLHTLTEKIMAGNKVATPFFVHSMSASTAVQQQAAQLYAQAKHPRALLSLSVKHAHTKIKIAYFSADFRNHPITHLITGLLERHDRTRFEVFAFSSNTPVEKSPARLRLEAACDHFIDASQQSDEQVVQLARQLEIDIAIDLNGFTDGCRTDIFALRAAPIQVVYLGYLGTMGTDYMDYILADSTLIPDEHQAHYNEKIAYLPHSFQVNDSKLPIANRSFTRAECGLPAHGFVFCCFNNNYKITPTVFASWMRILQQVDGSVLWLLEDNDAVISNLRREATVRGVNPERIVFAKRLPMPEYLARHRVADLFLDTQPYNAGATASGALWSGLPVLTCLGSTFAGRMAASLLNAIGLPELIVASLADYETLAVQLATHPEQLAAIKQKLADNRLTYPLFDTALFTRHIESAYQMMFNRYQADLAPEHIYVQAQESIMPADHANQFQHAMRLHQQGQLTEAEALYEDILRTQPQHIDALHFLGVLKNQQGQTQRAVELISQSLALYPDNAAAQCNLALALQSLQRLDEALACYDKVLALQPNSIDARSGRGIVLQMLNRFDEALLDYERILAIDPHHAEALFGRANVLYKLKRLDDALISYQNSLAINPDSVEALYNQGLLLVELNRIDDAITSYQHALAIKADYAEVHHSLGSLLKKQQRHAEAEASYQRAIASKPDYMEAYCNLITLLKDEGLIKDAQVTVNAALAALPDSLELRFIQLIMSLPMVTHTVTEAALVATHFDTALSDLENWLMQSPRHQHSLATAGLLPLPFLLAYRTGNHVQRLSRYGDMVAVQGNAVAVDKTRTKLKMVVVSHHFHRHSVWDVITRGLLVNIDRSRFELVLYHLGSLEDSETAFAKSRADVWRDTQTVSDVHGWLAVLADDKPDVIFYPEIGMDPMSARLAAHRLAPLQIASWGHPITTGLPAIDLYFSGDLLESAEADNHYRERLIRLPSTGCCTTLFNVTPEPLPELEAQLATRQGINFIIPQTVYKFDPADDELYADIASVVGNCTFILLRGRDNAWAMDKVVKRLEQTFIDRGLPPDQHLLIIPWQTVEKFQTLLDLCDVYLDCPSFSGYTTAWQAAHRGIPIVTLEGEFMRQRLAAGLLRKIGITDTIAQSREKYVQLAAKLAEECRSPIARNARRQRLKAAAPKADNDVSVVRAFEQTVLQTLAEKGR